MTRTIIVNGTEFAAFGWIEGPIPQSLADPPPPPHQRNEELLKTGVTELRPGEARFQCDQTLAFDTTFSLKGDGRKFVIISSRGGEHVAKPY